MDVFPCISCTENAGDIFLCGEGMICTECMSKLTGEDEGLLFDEQNVTDEIRDKTRERLQEVRSSGN